MPAHAAMALPSSRSRSRPRSRPRRRPGARLPLALALTVLAGASRDAAAGRKDDDLPYVASAKKGVSADLAALAGKGVMIGVRELRGFERARFFHDLTGKPMDPFAVRADGGPRFLTFVVEVENRGPAELLYNPSFGELRAPAERRFPQGYTALYSYLAGVLDDDAAVARLAPHVAETVLSIAPGERTMQLLVFTRPPPAKSLRVGVGAFLVERKDLRPWVEFERARPPR